MDDKEFYRLCHHNPAKANDAKYLLLSERYRSSSGVFGFQKSIFVERFVYKVRATLLQV